MLVAFFIILYFHLEYCCLLKCPYKSASSKKIPWVEKDTNCIFKIQRKVECGNVQLRTAKCGTCGMCNEECQMWNMWDVQWGMPNVEHVGCANEECGMCNEKCEMCGMWNVQWEMTLELAQKCLEITGFVTDTPTWLKPQSRFMRFQGPRIAGLDTLQLFSKYFYRWKKLDFSKHKFENLKV
jgi:hypothetical protein